jgi:ATP-binding cassette subfamily F protein 1
MSNKGQPQINYTTLFSDKEFEVLISGKTLINKSEIVINDQTKYLLIGPNGSGKTTVLHILYDKLKHNNNVLIVEQDVVLSSLDQTVEDFILSADLELYEKYKQMVMLEEKDDLTDEEHSLYEELSEYVYSKQWDSYQAESFKILNGLGFTKGQVVNSLSGGWRVRLALGKALLCKPSILMLDEPTNHLDLNAVIWLTNYLENYKKTLIVVTHQINLIDSLADWIWYVGNPDLTGTKLYTIKGQYNKYIQRMQQIYEEMDQKYNKFQKQLTNMRRGNVTKRQIEEFIQQHGALRPPKPYKVNLLFDNIEGKIGSQNIVELREVSFSYNNKKSIFDKIDFSISMDSKYVLVGLNGAGKTTLFSLIMNNLDPINGYMIKDDRIRIGLYHQQIIENLRLDLTPIEYMQLIDPKLDIGQIRGKLGKVGIKKNDIMDQCMTKINNLSGGQKARVAMSIVQMNSPHIILMDEPTNHLDLESIEGLIEAINNFNGGIVVITHDIYLINSINNCRLIEVGNGKVNYFNGDFSDYCNKIIDN